MRGNSFCVAAVVSALLAVSCSSGTQLPVLPGEQGLGSSAQIVSAGTSRTVWGVWEVSIDTRTWEATVLPLRGSQYTVDVVTFLQKPGGNPANLTIAVTDMTDWLTQGLITVDVGLRHPFPGLDEYTGFDVLGVFVAPGSTAGSYDSDVAYTNGLDEPILRNSDGYTRWMNPVEFPPNGTIFRFVPGKLGTPDIGLFTSTVNAYRYFADGLAKEEDVADFYSDPANVEDRGAFRTGSFNHRGYDLKFPMVAGLPQVIFQYAVIAGWVQPDKTLSGDPDALDVPGDFPMSANASEAFNLKVTNQSTLYYKDGAGGGSVKLGLEVYDWGTLQGSHQVIDEIHRIVVEGKPDIVPGGHRIFEQADLAPSAVPGSSIVSSVFEVEIADCTPSSNDDVGLLITIESMSPDSFDPGTGIPANDDRLAAYALTMVPVSTEIPAGIEVLDPNGGETLWMAMSHEIKWGPGPGGIANVKIEWSTDDFVSDVQVIAASTPNDGSYAWKPIPNVETDTARVRVSDVLGAGSDTSDGDFSIALPVWLNFQDEVEVTESTATFSNLAGEPYGYHKSWDEFSPAISQDDGSSAHICWHAWGYDYNSVGWWLKWGWDVGIRSAQGTSWWGENRFFQSSTGPENPVEMRGDYMKLASAANHFTFAAIDHMKIYFCGYVDYYINIKTYHYNSNCVNQCPIVFSNMELMADDKYLYMVGDSYRTGGPVSDEPGIYSLRVETPDGTVPWLYVTLTTLTTYGEVSHSRSWAFYDGNLVLACHTQDGKIKLLRQTNQTLDTWDDTEVIFDGTGYSGCKNPALAADKTGRLFAIWTGQETSGGEYRLLASMKESATATWLTPIVVAGSSEPFDDQHISCSTDEVLLPTGDSEYLVLAGYETGGVAISRISPMDLWAFLPAQQVSAEEDVARDPDTLCMATPYLYDALFAWSFEAAEDDWDIKFRNADFETP